MSPAAKVEEEPTYTPRAEIDEDDSQVLYRDDRYAGLSNIEQAIKSNEARNVRGGRRRPELASRRWGVALTRCTLHRPSTM